MGVRESPAERRTIPNRMEAVRNSMGRYRILKYREAISRMPGSTCIHTGTCPAAARVRTVSRVPSTSAARHAWALACRARSGRPAPNCRAIKARKPTPTADTTLPIIQLTVDVAPTAAVAAVPREPTMAVSIYCTAVWVSCSSMVGQARVKMAASMVRSNLFSRRMPFLPFRMFVSAGIQRRISP